MLYNAVYDTALLIDVQSNVLSHKSFYAQKGYSLLANTMKYFNIQTTLNYTAKYSLLNSPHLLLIDV